MVFWVQTIFKILLLSLRIKVKFLYRPNISLIHYHTLCDTASIFYFCYSCFDLIKWSGNSLLNLITISRCMFTSLLLTFTRKQYSAVFNRIFVTKMSVIDLGMYGGRPGGRAAIKCCPCITSWTVQPKLLKFWYVVTDN